MSSDVNLFSFNLKDKTGHWILKKKLDFTEWLREEDVGKQKTKPSVENCPQPDQNTRNMDNINRKMEKQIFSRTGLNRSDGWSRTTRTDPFCTFWMKQTPSPWAGWQECVERIGSGWVASEVLIAALRMFLAALSCNLWSFNSSAELPSFPAH